MGGDIALGRRGGGSPEGPERKRRTAEPLTRPAISLGLTAARRWVTIPARQARAFRVIDNRTSELTSWNTDLLPDALSGLSDLDIFSFDDVLPLAVTAGKTDPDDIPETPKNPVTRTGNLLGAREAPDRVRRHESCWYAVKKGAQAHWKGDRKASTLWEIDNSLGARRWRYVGLAADPRAVGPRADRRRVTARRVPAARLGQGAAHFCGACCGGSGRGPIRSGGRGWRSPICGTVRPSTVTGCGQPGRAWRGIPGAGW